VPYFHITITVPAELRPVLRANQRDGYGVLMQACAAAIIELARDPRYVGGTVAVLAVLHTWTQQLNLHPHVHCLVSGGGISEDASTWHPARRKFLLPIKALARLVRGKFRALLHRKRPDLVIPDAAWRTRWIFHVPPEAPVSRPCSTTSPATKPRLSAQPPSVLHKISIAPIDSQTPHVRPTELLRRLRAAQILNSFATRISSSMVIFNPAGTNSQPTPIA
jgi:Putative transposase